ncbi:MAG: HAMP domain-containing protein [Candidatus Aminicenantes bacterium]|nr:HAMP domain-containing protein [Candidatus Aminicenantes bacterium]
MFWAIVLLMVLVVSILLLIEQREVKAIFEEQKEKGVLIAKNIAYLNLPAFIQWDEEGVRENIEEQIDENLIYVVFYGRYNNLFVHTSFIGYYKDIYLYSDLGEEIDEKSYLFERKRFEDKKTGQILRILEIEVPIFVRGSPRRWGSIKIGLSLEEMRAEILKTRLMLIFIGCGGLLIGAFGAVLLARRITGPLKKLVEGTVKISKEDFTQKIDITSQDEIGNLAQSFNDMSRKLLLARERMEAASNKLIQAEKLASIGRISTGIAHEIRNALTSVKLNIQKLVQSDRLDEIEKEHLSISQEGISQMEKFIKELLDFARVSELNLDRFSIEQILDESIKALADTLELKKVVLEKSYEKGLPQVLVDADKLKQVFLNILRNAFEAVEEKGKINISLSLLKEKEASKIRVFISDNGCGIPEEKREAVFEPFYTTKPSGIGLGLPIARKIIEQHRGTIRVKENPAKGTSFEILIPAEEER